MTKRVLGILDCDDLAPELKDEYQNYGRMFGQLLAPLDSGWELKTFRVLEDDWPESPAECDAYLLTGSKTGVYDSDPWLAPLREFVRQAFDQDIPLVGICFGHQFLADTLGGRAEKSNKGWGVGVRQVHSQYSAPWMEPKVENLNLLYSHQDQVTVLPDSAQCLYGDDFCPLAAFIVPKRILAFQGHPEFTKPYMAGLMKLRKARYAPGQYDQAVSSLEKDEHGDIVAQWIFQFLDHAEQSRGE